MCTVSAQLSQAGVKSSDLRAQRKLRIQLCNGFYCISCSKNQASKWMSKHSCCLRLRGWCKGHARLLASPWSLGISVPARLPVSGGDSCSPCSAAGITRLPIAAAPWGEPCPGDMGWHGFASSCWSDSRLSYPWITPGTFWLLAVSASARGKAGQGELKKHVQHLAQGHLGFINTGGLDPRLSNFYLLPFPLSHTACLHCAEECCTAALQDN